MSPPTDSPPPGTPLSDEAIQQGKVLTLEWPSSLRYAWDTGIAIGRFLEELKNGRIIGPILVAVIEIDGATSGGFLHHLGEVKPEEIRIGMKVKAVWKPPE